MCAESEELSDSQNVGMPDTITGLNKTSPIAVDCRIAPIITGFTIRITVSKLLLQISLAFMWSCLF